MSHHRRIADLLDSDHAGARAYAAASVAANRAYAHAVAAYARAGYDAVCAIDDGYLAREASDSAIAAVNARVDYDTAHAAASVAAGTAFAAVHAHAVARANLRVR